MDRFLFFSYLALLTMFHPSFSQNIVVNGTFEEPRITDGGFKTYSLGESFPGWLVVAGDVDVVREHLPNWGPTQTLDLNGFGPGAIQQLLMTQPEFSYRLTFQFKVNHQNSTPPDQLLSAQALWNDTVIAEWTRPWVSFNPPPFETMSVYATGTGHDTLAFRSLSGETGSFIIDNVSVVAVPEPSIIAIGTLGAVSILGCSVGRKWSRDRLLLSPWSK